MESNYPNLISATIIKDSRGLQGDRITTFKLVFPRYILAELNTHRVFSKNSASSRAIPFRKMVKSALENPFIPIAFQKEHTHMQGTEYLDTDAEYTFKGFKEILTRVFKYESNDIERILNGDVEEEDEIFNSVYNLMSNPVIYKKMTLVDWWLYCRDKAVESAIIMSALGVTKQLCNRILEPFLYHTVLLTATEYYNFFKLRCPQYIIPNSRIFEDTFFKSKEEVKKALIDNNFNRAEKEFDAITGLEWLMYNKGAGEIHIMDLAEKMYNVLNESTPEQLVAGEWHIPYGDNIDNTEVMRITPKSGSIHPEEDSSALEGAFYSDVFDNILKIATARMARISYETLGDNPKIDYEADIKLHDDLLAMEHWSPFEHCAKCMTDEEYLENIKGKIALEDAEPDEYYYVANPNHKQIFGWSANFKGFIQYRQILQDNA